MEVKGNQLIPMQEREGAAVLDSNPIRHKFSHIPGFMFHAGAFIGFQSPPRKQMIRVKEVGTDYEEAFEILLPWLVYVVSIFDGHVSNIYIYGSENRISSLTQRFYQLPLPNLYEDGRFCLPGGSYETSEDVEDIYATIFEIVWDSYYNRDLFDRVMDSIDVFRFLSPPEEFEGSGILKAAYYDMMSPGEVFRQWEEKISLDNLGDLFNYNRRVKTQRLREQLPYCSARTMVRINGLHCLG